MNFAIFGYGYLFELSDKSLKDIVPSLKNYIYYFNSQNRTLFVTFKDKHIKLDTNSYNILSNFDIDQQWIIDHSNLFGSDLSLVEFNYFEHIKLKILSFNLAYNVQSNQVKGSEAAMVSLLQYVYPTYNGWSDSSNQISKASLNVKEFISTELPDLMGLQEVRGEYLVKIINQNIYDIVGDKGTVVVYNKNKLGKGYQISHVDLHIKEPGRGMIVVYFPNVKLLFINLHAPHNVDLHDEIQKTLNQVSFIPLLYINRIIVTGDFNDAYRAPLKELKLLNFILKQPNQAIKSCCSDNNYSLIGDYIFDSEYEIEGYYGVPKTAEKYRYNKHILMSDHYPIVYEQN